VRVMTTAVHRALRDPRQHDMPGVKMVLAQHGTCTTPVRVPVLVDGARAVDLERTVRCRLCPGCLRSRQHQWRIRAREECQELRTYMFTGTFRTQTHDRELVAQEVTLWLKRLRKRAGSPSSVRYLVVFERHRSGAWHVHALVHTVALSMRAIEATWRAGYTRCRLVRADPLGISAGYVTKYVTKDVAESSTGRRPRIRASRGYGAAVVIRDPEVLQALAASLPAVPLQRLWATNLTDVLRSVRCQPSVERVMEARIYGTETETRTRRRPAAHGPP